VEWYIRLRIESERTMQIARQNEKKRGDTTSFYNRTKRKEKEKIACKLLYVILGQLKIGKKKEKKKRCFKFPRGENKRKRITAQYYCIQC
jgi:hypothetical protein